MKTTPKIRGIGLALGLAIFLAVSLLLNVSAYRSSFLPKATTENPPAKTSGAAITAPSDDIPTLAEQLSKAYAAVAAQARPIVVSVYSEKLVKSRREDLPFPLPFGDEMETPMRGRPQRGMGSGIVLDSEGHILTNNHVVADVDSIRVQLADKRQFDAEVVSTDPKTDVAVIHLKGKVPEGMPIARLGNSDALQVGEIVLAVGAPFGLVQTVTQGIISATGRGNVGIADYEDFLQTDAPINPGNSGGPLVNMRGEVIGMNSAIATNLGQSAGVGFAIPINMIKSMLPSLTQGKSVMRGMLGVGIQDLSEELAKQFRAPSTQGSLVSQVNRNSPAEKAGIERGDVIVSFDGHEIQDTHQLRNLAAATEPGTEAKVRVLRDGEPKEFVIKVGKMNPEDGASGTREDSRRGLATLGFSAQTLTPELGSQLGLDEEHGVLITRVQEGGLAAKSGLVIGDVILEIDRQKVENTNELQEILEKAASRENLLLLIRRRGASLFISLQMQ